jgi:hypothetical protein
MNISNQDGVDKIYQMATFTRVNFQTENQTAMGSTPGNKGKYTRANFKRH